MLNRQRIRFQGAERTGFVQSTISWIVTKEEKDRKRIPLELNMDWRNKYRNTGTRRLAGNFMPDFMWIEIMRADCKGSFGNRCGSPRELI